MKKKKINSRCPVEAPKCQSSALVLNSRGLGAEKGVLPQAEGELGRKVGRDPEQGEFLPRQMTCEV